MLNVGKIKEFLFINLTLYCLSRFETYLNMYKTNCIIYKKTLKSFSVAGFGSEEK